MLQEKERVILLFIKTHFIFPIFPCRNWHGPVGTTWSAYWHTDIMSYWHNWFVFSRYFLFSVVTYFSFPFHSNKMAPAIRTFSPSLQNPWSTSALTHVCTCLDHSLCHTFSAISLCYDIPSSLVTSEWLYNPDNIAPPSLYFDTKKLGAWARMADYLEVFKTVLL